MAKGDQVIETVCLFVVVKQPKWFNVMNVKRLPNIEFCNAATLTSMLIAISRELSLLPPVRTAIRSAASIPRWVSIAGLTDRLAVR